MSAVLFIDLSCLQIQLGNCLVFECSRKNVNTILTKTVSDMDDGPAVAALRAVPCPEGRSCFTPLSDRVMGAFVQTASRLKDKGIVRDKSVWVENFLRQTRVTEDGDVSVSGAVLCISCFSELCELLSLVFSASTIHLLSFLRLLDF